MIERHLRLLQRVQQLRREAPERRTEDQAGSTVLDRWKDADRSLAAGWESLRLDQQRATVAAVFAGIVISPADQHGRR